MLRLSAIALALCLAPSARAQLFFIDPAHRFELGQRLRLFERALESQTDAKARRRALVPLEKATPAFFSNRLADAAGLLDQARLLLASEKINDDAVWAESLIVKPSARLLDAAETELYLRVEPFYKVETKKPAAVSVRFTLAGSADAAEVKELPLKHRLVLKGVKEGDHSLKSEVLIDGKVLASGEQTISVVAKLSERLAALEKAVKPDDLVRGHPVILRDLAAKKTLETNYPAARLLKEAEEAVKAGKDYHGTHRPGQFWLTLGADAVRVQIPAGLRRDKPVPLVVAMHGAGGSENLFFDGYGDGKVAKLCAERGWVLVATRSGLFPIGSSLDVVRVVDALAKVYPVDTKKVLLVGHSMGAGQAVATAGRNPDRVAAVAALGGGGGFRNGDKLKAVPFFVGCGDRDFALGGARNLHKQLEKAEIKKATFKLYADVEHLTIVQLALADVFAFFDDAAK